MSDQQEPKLDYICAEDLQSSARKVSDLTISEKPIGGESHV